MFLRVGLEDIKVSLKDTGTVLTYAGLSFFVPIILAIIIDKNSFNLLAYSISALLLFMLGYSLKTIVVTKKETEPKHAMLSIVLIWLLYCLFASLPFAIIMRISPLDAFFEVMSSLTTTGLTVMNPLLDVTPLSLIFWRTFLGWIGGVGIVLMALIGLMTTYSKTIRLLGAEGRGDQFKENIRSSAKKISSIYIMLTLFGVLLLLLSGLGVWESVNYSMSLISTTGMDITTDGMVGENSPLLIISLTVIMILGAMSFSLHYLWMRKRDFRIVFADPEFRALIFIGGVGTIFLAAKMGFLYGFLESFSALTCGSAAVFVPNFFFSMDDFTKTIIIILMIIGGSAGSTAGGIKISRLLIFLKGVYWKIKSTVLPQEAYFKTTYNGENVSSSQLKEINQFILLWIIFLAIGTFVIMGYGYDFGNAFFEVASAQSNVGISTGITNINMPTGVEVMLIINMFVGRLEIIPLMASVGLLLSLKKRRS